MRDFNNEGNITVNGDFTISDNSSNEHKLLVDCSNEELLAERPYRLKNVKIEQKIKTRNRLPIYLASIVGICIAAYIYDDNIYSLFTGTISVVIGLITLRTNFAYNEFQQIEMAAVKEIDLILKQRRVRY